MSRHSWIILRPTFVRGKCLRYITRTDKFIYANPRYAVSEWNVYTRFEEQLEQTTNIAEAHHRRIQACNVYGDHPSLWKLASLLLDVNQRASHAMTQHITEGAPAKKQRKKDANKDQNLLRLYKRFNAGEMVRNDYIFG